MFIHVHHVYDEQVIEEGRRFGYPSFCYTVLFVHTHLCTQVCLRLLCANSFYNSQGSKQ